MSRVRRIYVEKRPAYAVRARELTEELREYLNLAIRRDLSDLQTRGIIRHDGPDKGGRWIIMIRDHDNS